MDLWDRIAEFTKLPSRENFSELIDLTEDVQLENWPYEEKIKYILDRIGSLDSNAALFLPEQILFKVDARTVMKNSKQLKLRRIKSRKEAIENEITPEKLIKEKIEELQIKYQEGEEKLIRENYGWINFRGITDRKNKNYFIGDAIEAYLYWKEFGNFMNVKRYDTLESLLKEQRREIPLEIRANIAKEIKKIRNRKTLTEKEREHLGFIRGLIIKKQAERIVEVPSRSKREYYSIKFRKLPLSFPDSITPELNKEFYGTWQDIVIESCPCAENKYFISYINPAEIWYCFHQIVAYRKMISLDWKKENDSYVPATYPNPYIACSPFFKPHKESIQFYEKCRKQVFVKKVGEEDGREKVVYEHLPRVYATLFLMKQVIRGKVELL